MHDMPFSDDDLELALERFLSPNPVTAEIGYNTLCDYLKKWVPQRLKRILPAKGVDDVYQDTLVKLWTARTTYVNRGLNRFRKFVICIAVNCALDWIRKERGEVVGEPAGEPIDEAAFAVFERISLDPGMIPRAADQEWLRQQPGEDEIELRKRVLAVAYVRLDKMPPRTAWRLSMGAAPYDQAALAAWMDDPAILLRLAYDTLYRDGDQIVVHLLGLPEDTGERELNGLYMKARNPNHKERVHEEFTNAEVAEVFLRYRYEELLISVRSMTENSHTSDDLKRLFDRCNARLPFVGYMEELKSSFGPTHAPLLKYPGLWKRLVFQYGVVETLPQKDVGYRTCAAAELADYRLTEGMINVWISNHRLVDELWPRLKRMMDGSDA